MDKNRKKEILNEYKKGELEKLSQSGDKVLSNFAKNRLGIKSGELSLERLKNIDDDRLIEAIIEKINEVLEVRYKADPRRYKNSDNVLRDLNGSLRAVHFTNLFEMYARMGDAEKFYESASQYELAEVVNGYRLFKLDNVCYMIALRRANDLVDELSDENRIDAIKIKYIREHLNEFELN